MMISQNRRHFTVFIVDLQANALAKLHSLLTISSLQGQVQSHVRVKHKLVNSKIVSANPMNPLVDGLFIVYFIVSVINCCYSEVFLLDKS